MKVVERGSKVRLNHVYVDLDGTPVAPTLPTVTVKDPGSTKKVDAAIPTASGTGEKRYYDLTVALSDPTGFWMVEWSANGIVQPTFPGNPAREIFHVVETQPGTHAARQPVQIG